jgi:PPOX class probable F420-dependent enzyme
MRLDPLRCHDLLEHSERGTLGTVHAERGVDAVPVCFVAEGSTVAVPVDTVKPKRSIGLQRVKNLDADPRAVLLCDHWDAADWTRLWWVRASLERVDVDAPALDHLATLLSGKYSQYHDRPFADLVVFSVVDLTGWSGERDSGP